MDDLHKLSKEAAEYALRRARQAGYEVKNERGPFLTSDLLNLADDISFWIEGHMAKEKS